MVLEPLGLNVTDAAKALGVTRPDLSNLLNANASLSPEMAIRLDKAFGIDMEALMRMQIITISPASSSARAISMLRRIDDEHPKYRGQHAYQAEGRLLDADGVQLDMVVYADENHRLLELEFIRWEGDPYNKT